MDDLRESAFRRHHTQVFRYLRRRTETDDEAEELTQEVFAAAAAGLRRFAPGPTPVLAWLYTVAQRRLADRARQRARSLHTLHELDAERVHLVEQPEYGPGIARVLRDAIARLPELQREAVVMKLLEGRSFAEIAKRTGATEAACKMRFARGLESVREEFTREGIEP